MSSDDEFELDFVSNASKQVKNKWKKIESEEREKSELKDVTNKNGFGLGVAKKKKKSNNFMDSDDQRVSNTDRTVEDDKDDDDDEEEKEEEKTKKPSDVTITPPGSPTGMESVKVRGAKATKKTMTALNKLQSNSQKLLVSKRQGQYRDRDLEDMEDCRVVNSGPNDSKFELKIVWKSSVERLEVAATDRVGKVVDDFAKKVGAERGGLSLYRDEVSGDPLARDQSLAELQVSIVTVLHARTKVTTGTEAESELLELKLQTKDRRAQAVTVKIKPIDSMETVMVKYSQETGLDRAKLKFFFDGEELNGDDTGEDLELEGGECFDVHIKN